MKLAGLIPWDKLASIYAQSLRSDSGRETVDIHMVIGALIVKHKMVLNDQVLGAIHLISAAGFFIIMGWMAFFKFTKGQIFGTQKRKKNLLFRICGIGGWASLIFISIDKWGPLSLTKYGTFIGETIALVFFGTAWLVKGGSLKKFGL